MPDDDAQPRSTGKAYRDSNPDRFGEELADDAHIWRVYDDVAKQDDKARVGNWNRGLDNLALFATLFSAVTTAFLIEARKDMEPDYSLQVFRVLNATAFKEPFVPEHFTVPWRARVVNCLWVASLLFSLTAALIAIMGKDWIGMYELRPPCNPRQWADIRTFRLYCVGRWHMSTVIASAPVLLHFSLLLFGLGLVFFLTDDLTTWILTMVLCALAGLLYGVIVFSAIFSPSSPFQSPATLALRRLLLASIRRRQKTGPGLPIPDDKDAPVPGEVQVVPQLATAVQDLAPAQALTEAVPGAMPPIAVQGHVGADALDAPEQRASRWEWLKRGLRGWRQHSRAGSTDIQLLPGPQMSIEAPRPSRSSFGASLRNLWQRLRNGLWQQSSSNSQPPGAPTVDEAHAAGQSHIYAAKSDASAWKPSLDHWHDVPSATPNSSVQSLAWLSAADPSPEIQRVIATALGDRNIGHELADRLSDRFLNSGTLSEKNRLLWQKLRTNVELTVSSQNADLHTVTRRVILKRNMDSITLPEKGWLGARFWDALYDDTVPSLDYVYAACWASNWVEVDLGKLRAHSKRVYLDLHTASVLWTLAQPLPGAMQRPSYDALFIMAASFGWHRNPSSSADTLTFAVGLMTCISEELRTPLNNYTWALPAIYRSKSDEIELLTFLIINYTRSAVPEALDVLLDRLLDLPGEYLCLLHILDDEQHPEVARAVWGIFERSPLKALHLMKSLPLDAAGRGFEWDTPLNLQFDLIQAVIRFLSLDWAHDSPLETSTTSRYLAHLCSQLGSSPDTRWNSEIPAVIRLIFEFPVLLRPEHRPVDCSWDILTEIASYLGRLLSTEDSDNPLTSDLVSLLGLFTLSVVDTGILGQSPPIVPFSPALRTFISTLETLRELCDKHKEVASAFSGYPPRIDLENWTSIRAGELTLHRAPRAIPGARCDIFRGTFRNTVVAVKILRAGPLGGDADGNGRIESVHKAEFSRLMGLSHPNIMFPVAAGYDSSYGLLTIFPWMEHGTILQYSQRFPKADRISLVLDVAQGLEYLHTQSPQILHLNMSPDNVLVDSAGRAIITSFASSKEIHPDEAQGNDAEEPPHNYRYLAPEALDYGTRSSSAMEVFSWAMSALHVISGVAPIPRRSDVFVAILYNVGRRPDKNEHTANMTDAMWELLECCWVQEPMARPSMSEVVQQLRAMPDTTVETRSPSLWPAFRAVRRWRGRGGTGVAGNS